MRTFETQPTCRPTRRPGRRHRGPLAALAATVAVALPAVACSGDDDDDAAATGAGDMTIAVTEPGDGAEVGPEFDVTVDSSVPLGEPDTGRHHVHLYYDGNTAEGEYDLVYGPSFTVDRLDPGEHTVEAVIANADHSLTDARDEITVTVGEDGSDGSGTGTGGTGGGSDAPTTTEADDGGADPYGY
jgi:hypothetical protein